jgi:hypothetical protein
LVEGQTGDRLEVAAILVAPGPVEQKVFDGENVQPSQLGGALRPDAG